MKPVIPGRLEAVSPQAPANRGALAGLSLSMLLASLGTSIANVGLPTFAQAFDASFQQVQWVVLAYLLTGTALMVGIGRLGDIVGRRRLLVAGIATFTLASLLCSLAPTLWILICLRAIQGLGAAIMMALALALVGDAAPKASIGRAMGLLGATSAIGTALGPVLGGVLIAAAGWRAIFLVSLPLGLLAFILRAGTCPADREGGSYSLAGFDIAGTTLFALALVAYALAMTVGRGSFGAANIALLLVGALGFGLFVRVEARTTSPLIQQATLREPVLRAGLVMSVLVSAVMMTTLLVGPFYLAGALGLNTAHVGLAVSVGPVVVALTGVPAGRIADRFGAHNVITAGLVAMTIGCAFLSMISTADGVPGYIAAIAIVTAGYALFQTANNTAVMADVAADRRGVVSGLLNLSRNLGLITGGSVMGAAFALGSGASDIAAARAEDIAQGTRITFVVAAILIGIALATAFATRTLFARRLSEQRS